MDVDVFKLIESCHRRYLWKFHSFGTLHRTCILKHSENAKVTVNQLQCFVRGDSLRFKLEGSTARYILSGSPWNATNKSVENELKLASEPAHVL